MIDGLRIIQVMSERGYEVLARNIVYIGSCDLDGNLYPQKPDQWNDVRLIVSNKGEVLHKSEATIRPGQAYMDYPMNPDGCALVAYGQHKNAWVFGTHGYTYPHESLVQCDNIRVHRVKDGSYSRRSQPVIASPGCGINQHSTGLYSYRSSVGNWSAGCLVSASFEEHQRFMDILYDSGRKCFSTTLLPWRLTFGDGQLNEGVVVL